MPQSPFYNSKQWRDARGKYLRLNPNCEICLKLGIETKAVDVDHIRPINSGGAPLDPRNFCAQCKTHHSQKTRVLDTPGIPGRKFLVTTGPDGFPCHVEVSHNAPKPRTGRR